jgi:hypothetical protein
VRIVILATAFVFTVALAAMTAYVMATDGVTPLVVISFGVLALFTFGILGALRSPPGA